MRVGRSGTSGNKALKNHGYSLEYNFGHGEEYASEDTPYTHWVAVGNKIALFRQDAWQADMMTSFGISSDGNTLILELEFEGHPVGLMLRRN